MILRLAAFGRTTPPRSPERGTSMRPSRCPAALQRDREGKTPDDDDTRDRSMRAIQDAARVQKKPIYERSNGSCELAQLLNARSTSGLANAWGPFVDQSYPQIPRTRLINRELSLLAFQRRVLEEAGDPANPLLERVKFLAIVGSNIDEFFMVRVSGLLEQRDAGILDVGPDGMSPGAQLVTIRREVKKLSSDAQRCLTDRLLPELREAGIQILQYSDLRPEQRAFADGYFTEVIFPVLTPLAFDPGRPFPHISNLSVNLAVLIRDSKGAEHFARVKVPDSLPQFISLRPAKKKSIKRYRGPENLAFVWIEQVIAANLSALFRDMEVIEAHAFKVTRDADLEIQELEAADLLETIEEGVGQRRFGD